MSTEQLKALRDATIAYYGAKMSSDLVAICDRAIASLEAAEQAQQPAPADVPPMPKAWPYNGGQWCKANAVRVLHTACVRIAAERDEARREAKLWDEEASFRGARADKAEAELSALKGQKPVAWVDSSSRHCIRWDLSRFASLLNETALYAAPVPPSDCISLAQHEAIVAAVRGQVAKARREGLREAEELVRRDAKAAVGKPGPEWATLTIAADGIRALALKGGEVGKP